MTPLKPNTAIHPTATKRSLYRDLENQYLATQHGVVASSENVDPDKWLEEDTRSLLQSSSFNESCSTSACEKSGHVSVIKKASNVLDANVLSSPQKRMYSLLDNGVNISIISPVKSPRKREEQHARYVSALALIQLAQGAN